MPSETIPPIVNFNGRPEADAVAKIVTEHLRAQIVSLERGDDQVASVLVIPKGSEVKSLKALLDEYLPAPERRRGTANVQDLASFIAHVNRFKDENSALFADPNPSGPKLVAVLDYHRGGPEGGARFGEHRTVYHFPLSDEWKAWTSKNAHPMTQADFAAFLEDRIADVTDPANPGTMANNLFEKLGVQVASPSRLLELSKGLRVRVDSKIHEARNLQTGETQFQYVTAHQDDSGAPLKVPGAFVIAIPVFRGGGNAIYKIAVRLRYRLTQAISWFFEMYRTDVIFDDAFKEACNRAQAETTSPLFTGSPEV